MGELSWLRRAIALAAEARGQGDPPFGSLLLAADGVVLAEERNTTVSDRDVTAHPELKLARWAARELTPERARAATMFTSCQPCPMCAGAIARSGLGRVVYALATEQLQELKPSDSIAPDSTLIDYEGPFLLEEARLPVDGYYS
ncbi:MULTISPECIES: nucleoside deaminase [unclassified Rathayibacter]|uniref:nucleoside deaminase n=1 Tax=unclassified Rathayibacter TaxID=2609250 RepID=UPI00188BBB50|nr:MULTISPECIES: nucleoside deaminase [unclassified Rathayibacter]MBF4462611.1 nucleoside deaminase [Rathayibacter sp. VKM Ac-2879]MBF4503346.1 nucleoside deaminase [Rathayibacter sp. VKM Ac-2878]